MGRASRWAALVGLRWRSAIWARRSLFVAPAYLSRVHRRIFWIASWLIVSLSDVFWTVPVRDGLPGQTQAFSLCGRVNGADSKDTQKWIRRTSSSLGQAILYLFPLLGVFHAVPIILFNHGGTHHLRKPRRPF